MSKLALYKAFLNQNQPLSYYFHQLTIFFPQLLVDEKWLILSVWFDQSIYQLSLKINQSFCLQKYSAILILNQLSDKVPLPVILGFTYYDDKKFFCSSQCFMPRPDSAYLVDILANKIKAQKIAFARLIDLFCGVGNLGIALAKKINFQSIYGVDINNVAVWFANYNASYHHLNNYSAYNCDWSVILNKYSSSTALIVANPPYIPYKMYKLLPVSSIKYNPFISMFASDNGLYFYHKIFYAFAVSKILFKMFACEVPWYHIQSLKKLIKFYLPTASYEFLADLRGKIYYLVLTS